MSLRFYMNSRFNLSMERTVTKDVSMWQRVPSNCTVCAEQSKQVQCREERRGEERRGGRGVSSVQRKWRRDRCAEAGGRWELFEGLVLVGGNQWAQRRDTCTHLKEAEEASALCAWRSRQPTQPDEHGGLLLLRHAIANRPTITWKLSPQLLILRSTVQYTSKIFAVAHTISEHLFTLYKRLELE